MKKILATLLVMLPAISYGQDFQGKKISIMGFCLNAIEFSETIVKYGEIPMLTMNSNRMLDENLTMMQTFPMVLFANPTTGSWTLAEKRDTNEYCIVGLGDNVSPYSANNGQGT